MTTFHSMHPTFKAGDKLPVCQIHISQELIDQYAHLSGDFNPIHVDPAAGATSVFKGTIAHGCIPMEPVFQAILKWSTSDSLPPATKVRLRYRAPARPGDIIRSEVELISESSTDGARMVNMKFSCLNQNDQLVIDGECDYMR